MFCHKRNKMKKNAVATSTKTCAVKCTADKESKATIKKLTAENSKLAKALASATAKAAKAASASAAKLAKVQNKISKLQATVAALKAKKK